MATFISVSDFAKAKGFAQIAKATRKNINGYGYITFIDSANQAENIYFSKSLNSEIPEGTTISGSFFKNKKIAKVENAEGETRYKIVHEDSQRLDLADLL